MERFIAIACVLVFAAITSADELTPEQRKKLDAETHELNRKAVELFNSGKFVDAIPMLERVTANFFRLFPADKFPDGEENLAASHYNLGIAHQIAGNYDRAEEYLRKTLAMRRRLFPEAKFPGGSLHIAWSLNSLGHLLMRAGKYEEAAPSFEESLAMFRRLHKHDHGDVAHVLAGLGQLWRAAGDYRKSRSYYEESLAIYRRNLAGNDHLHLAKEIASFGLLLLDIGDLDAALVHSQEALAMYRRLIPKEQQEAGHPDIAAMYNDVASVLDAMGEYDRALPIYEQSLATFRGVYPPAKYPNGHPELALMCSNVASLLRRMGKLDLALPRQEEAVAIYRKFYPMSRFPDGHLNIIRGLTGLGRIRHQRLEVNEARTLYDESLAMARRLYPRQKFPDGHPQLATCLTYLGRARFDQGVPSEALALFGEALDVLGRHAARQLAGATEADAISFVGTMSDVRDNFVSVAQGVPDSDAQTYAHVWESKAMVTRVLERRRQAARAGGGLLREKWLQMQALSRRISDVMVGAIADPVSRDEALRDLTERRDALERNLAEAMPDLARSRERATSEPADLAKHLPVGTVFVDLLQYQPLTPLGAKSRLPPAYVAFVIVRGRSPVRIDLGPAPPIDSAVSLWRTAIESNGDDRAVANNVRDRVWAKIAVHIPDGTNTVYLAADGDLSRLPVSALPGTKPGTILLEQHAVAMVPHGPALVDQLRHPSRGPSGSALVLGGVAYGEKSDYSYLPGTAAEAKHVVTLAGKLPITLLSGSTATAARILELLPHAGYAHLATHGYFAERDLSDERKRVAELRRGFDVDAARIARRVGLGLRSPLTYTGLVVAGGQDNPGIITGEALVTLPLDNLKLCVLSACETGLGDLTGGEGVQGLVRAFHLAGCPNVIASLWRVSDAATSALMAKFYYEHWTNKRPIIEALREAQLTIYRRPDLIPDLAGVRGAPKLKDAVVVNASDPLGSAGRYSKTKLWAAFVLSGAGR